MSVFVGLDCGGSSSRVLAVDGEGAVLFQGHSGAANLVSTPDTRVRRNLMHATRGCPTPSFVCGCFAGLINDEVRQRGVVHLRELFPAADIRAEPDYTAAFYASPPGTDICVISGTGSLVCSRSEDRIVKSGGMGYILGDEGSAYHYGRDAIAHFLKQPTNTSDTLRRAILEQFGTFEESVIISAVYRSASPATVLGKFARPLGQDARSGEPYAVESLRRNTELLVDVVSEHVHRFLPLKKQLVLSLSGGLWKAFPLFRETFSAALGERLPQREFTVVRIARPPLYGAVELAKEMKIGN